MRELDLPPSLQASLDLWREDPKAWEAEWQRKQANAVKLTEAYRRHIELLAKRSLGGWHPACSPRRTEARGPP